MLIRFLKKQPLWVGGDTVIWSSLPGGLKLDSGGTSVSHCGAAIFVFKCTTALCSHDLHGGQTLSCKIRPVVVASAQRASILGEIVPVITQTKKKKQGADISDLHDRDTELWILFYFHKCLDWFFVWLGILLIFPSR